MPTLRRNFAALCAAIACTFAAHAYATATAASSQGPVFQGAPQAPSIILNTSNSLSTCVGDGGFTNCTSAPQQLTVSALQAGTCTTPCNLLGSLNGAAADGGVTLPGLSSTTLVTVTPSWQDNAHPESCGVTVNAPGGDGGVVTITCGPDAGVVTWMRLN